MLVLKIFAVVICSPLIVPVFLLGGFAYGVYHFVVFAFETAGDWVSELFTRIVK